MGADFPEDTLAIEMLQDLPREIKELLGHHLNNALTAVIVGIDTGNYDLAKRAAWHMADDLRLFGVNNFEKKGGGENNERNES